LYFRAKLEVKAIRKDCPPGKEEGKKALSSISTSFQRFIVQSLPFPSNDPASLALPPSGLPFLPMLPRRKPTTLQACGVFARRSLPVVPSSSLAVWAGCPSLLCSVRLWITGTNVVEWNSRRVTRSTVPRFEVQVVMITLGYALASLTGTPELANARENPSRIGNERRCGGTCGTTYLITLVRHEAADAESAPMPLAMPCLVPRHGGGSVARHEHRAKGRLSNSSEPPYLTTT
nr:hypothetical protein [Tanacetum cinerariifolium]